MYRERERERDIICMFFVFRVVGHTAKLILLFDLLAYSVSSSCATAQERCVLRGSAPLRARSSNSNITELRNDVCGRLAALLGLTWT